MRRRLGISSILLSVCLAIATLLTVLSTPAHAFQVQVQPTNPQLGDTITVLIQTDGTTGDSPSVTLNQTTYPAFSLSPNRYRALVPTTPLDRAGGINLQVNAGSHSETVALQLRDRSFPTQSLWISGVGSLGTDYEFDRVDEFKQIVTPERHWNGAFLRPSPGEITTVYGVRRYYNGEFAEDYFHRGVDYAAPTGDPIVAPAAGRVALVGRVENGFELHGNTIGIDHGQGVTSIFLHLSRIDVQEGDFVQAGQRIGAVGATGGVTGAHLHWGLYVHGQCVDPVPWRYGAIE
ncbi:M23 family metallopeptidase [Egbenema bharatensis]|uniref:M23 family metallopeptidase n=1 Tax=Egbenema bharatensis TaxID=3463334 RepID=UPI003A89CD69